MNPKILIAVAIVAALTGCATATKTVATTSSPVVPDGPVQFDTPDAHVIVIRALDSWSGDNSASKDSLAEVQDHKGCFVLRSEKGNRYDVMGAPNIFGGLIDNKIVQGVSAALKPMHFTLSPCSAVNFDIDKPVPLDPAMLGAFVKYQRELYKKLVIDEGDPTTLHRSVSARKFFAGVLSLGTIAVGADKYGSLGSGALLNSGIPGNVQNAASSGNATSGRTALTPLDLPDFDTSGYKSIDVRRVIQGNNDRAGQVIIAYKNDKTESAENNALIKAIVTLIGADTTVEAIQAARDADFTKRQTIWNACVAEGKCK